MGRLRPEFLERVENFSHRVVDVTEYIAKGRRTFRILYQMEGSGTSVGANVWEADEALSRKDFCKTLGIALKELNETRFWLRFVARRGRVRPQRLNGLGDEADELLKVLGTMIHRTRRAASKKQ